MPFKLNLQPLPKSNVTWPQLGIAFAILSVLLTITVYASRQPIPCAKDKTELAHYMHGGAQERVECKVAAEPSSAVK